MWLLLLMFNLIGFFRTLNTRNKEFGAVGIRMYKFFCPLGCFLGHLLIQEKDEKWEWMIYGAIGQIALTVGTLWMLSNVA